MIILKNIMIFLKAYIDPIANALIVFFISLIIGIG